MTTYAHWHEGYTRDGQYEEGRKRGEVSVWYDGMTDYYLIPTSIRPCAIDFKRWVKEVWGGDKEVRVTGRWPAYVVE